MPRLMYIKLTPKASVNKIGEYKILADQTKVLAVYVTAPPDKNKANEALLELLAAHLGIAPSRLTLIKVHNARIKTIAIDD